MEDISKSLHDDFEKQISHSQEIDTAQILKLIQSTKQDILR